MFKFNIPIIAFILVGCSIQSNIPTPTGDISFRTADPYPGNYGLYDDIPSTRKIDTPITIDWVTAEQQRWNLPVHPFTHATLGLVSTDSFRPPFHVQVQCRFLYNADVMESVWLLNDFATNPTRELDLFESGFSWHRRLWMADHFGDSCYVNRVPSITHLWPRSGENQVDILVYPDHALRYLNGRLVKVTFKDLDYDFHVLVTMIVSSGMAEYVEWKPIVKISKLPRHE